jgi:uncharacterized protein (DUF362 family)
MTRRELLALAAAAPLARAATPPTAPVAIARATYDDNLSTILAGMFDQIGGAGRLVRNRTVTIKLNLTGSPGTKFQGRALGTTHYTHPKTVVAMIDALDRAGAKRIRLVESCWATAGPLEEYMLDSGWNVRALKGLSSKLEFENTNGLGHAKKYSRLKVPGGGQIFPAFELNHSYEDTDVFVSMAKLKNHATCGVTLAMKNIFGITPASIYGDDAGRDEPNESPSKGRGEVCHFGRRPPARIALPEIHAEPSHDPGYRMPRIVADLVATRPIDISFIDGIQTVTGGEGPWIRGLKFVEPGILLLGTNPVTTDAVGTAVMGYDPRALKGTAPFTNCDNTLLLAESLGIGTADLSRIEVRGLTVAEARFRFG